MLLVWLLVKSLRAHRLLLEPLVWAAPGRFLMLLPLECFGHELLLLLVGKLLEVLQDGDVRRQAGLRRFGRRTGFVHDECDGCFLHFGSLPPRGNREIVRRKPSQPGQTRETLLVATVVTGVAVAMGVTDPEITTQDYNQIKLTDTFIQISKSKLDWLAREQVAE